MANLLWKSNAKTKRLLATPFNAEEEFEKIVFETPEILGDVFLIKRQIRGGNKPGIPDIIGVDADGNICIVEMKNVEVDASIVPQVLEYAFWAESNPDSIKSLWSESDTKPDDLEIGWDDFQVRIIIIAPSIARTTSDIVNKIKYPVDLIEVKRWIENKNHFLLVNKLEEAKKAKSTPVRGIEAYDREFYKNHYNKKSVDDFFDYVNQVEKLIKAKKWQLEKKFNKHYCGFKAGAFNAFSIGWIGTKTFALKIKITENEAKKLRPKMTKYEPRWKEAYYYIVPGKTKVKGFVFLLSLAYKKLSG